MGVETGADPEEVVDVLLRMVELGASTTDEVDELEGGVEVSVVLVVDGADVVAVSAGSDVVEGTSEIGFWGGVAVIVNWGLVLPESPIKTMM